MSENIGIAMQNLTIFEHKTGTTYTNFTGKAFIYEENEYFQHTRNIHQHTLYGLQHTLNIHSTYTQHTREIHIRVIVPNMGIVSSQRGNKKKLGYLLIETRPLSHSKQATYSIIL